MLLSASPFMPDLASAPESPSALYRSCHPAEPVTYTAQVTVESLKSAWRGRPVNGNQESRLLLDPIERHPVLLPPRQAGQVAIAGIAQVNRILKRRNTNTRAPQQTVPCGQRLRCVSLVLGISIELPASPTSDMVRAWARFPGALLR